MTAVVGSPERQDLLTRLLRIWAPAPAATRLVDVRCAENHAGIAFDESLTSVGGRSAHDANGQRLRDVFGDGHELGNRLEGLAPKVLIEARDHHPAALVSEAVGDPNEVHVKELSLVNSNDNRVADPLQDLAGRAHGNAWVAKRAVGDDVALREAYVDRRLEDQYPRGRKPGTIEAPDQLLRLARKHAAANDLDPPRSHWSRARNHPFHAMTVKRSCGSGNATKERPNLSETGGAQGFVQLVIPSAPRHHRAHT